MLAANKARADRSVIEGVACGFIVFVLICVCLVALHALGMAALRTQVRDGLTRTAMTVAALVDGDQHARFVSPEQESTPAYREAVAPLQRVLQARNDIRFLYTMALIDNRARIILDATPPGDADHDGVEDHSPLMQPYDTPAPALLDALRTGREQADPEVVTDRWGKHLSAYAPIRDRLGRQTGVVGVDIRADTYAGRLSAMRRALRTGLFLAALLSIVLGMGVWYLRRSAWISATERQAAEAARGQSEARYRELVGALTDALFVHTIRSDGTLGPIIEVNDEACRRLGYTREQLIGQTPLLFDATDSPVDVAAIVRRLRSGEPVTFEQTHVTKDGRRIPVEIRARAIVLGGQPAVLSLVRDISERKQHERERERVQQQLLQAQKMEGLGLLAGGIAHDFNNLLMGVLGNADLALEEVYAHSPAREQLQQVKLTALQAAELCRQLLAYAGKGRFVIEPLNLSVVVQEMSNLLKVSVSKRAVLRLNLSSAMPVADADSTQVRQVVMNLVVNASESIGERSGAISVSTGAMDCDEAYLKGAHGDGTIRPGSYAYVEVADTGCGMDADTQARVFDPFFTTKFAGRGLGLAAVLGIVRGHHGAIKIQSEVGKGSTFRVLFPVSKEAALPPPAGGAAPGRWCGQGTVLLVDDEEHIRWLAKQMLEKIGFGVVIAADGREAVTVFQRDPAAYVCVVMDQTMPHMDGVTASREMRWIKPDVKVILTSGYSEDDINERFAGENLAGFLAKPYGMSAMREALRRAVG